MIEVEYPTLNVYMERVHRISAKYLGDENQWWNLDIKNILEENDRDEFSFIRMALWDKLMEKEFFTDYSPPGQPSLFGNCAIEEPGDNPGSSILGW